MEDSFKVRVDKVFGSLNSSSSSSLSSLWCLTDDEIERRQWNRDKTIPQPQLEKDLQDLDDDDDDKDLQGSESSKKPDDYNDEEWEIKSSIGRDSTLDYEVFFLFSIFLSFYDYYDSATKNHQKSILVVM